MNRVEYRLTNEDLLKFNMYHSANSDLHRKQRKRYRVLVPAIYSVFAIFLCLERSFVAASLFAAFAILWFLLSPMWVRRRYRKHYEKHIKETVGESLSKPLTIDLRPDGIYTSSYLGESKYRYSAVERIVENDGYTYVFLGKAMALVLPYDRIPKETIDLLVTEILRRKGEASQTPEAPLEGKTEVEM